VARLIDAHGQVVRGTVVQAGTSPSRLSVRVPRLPRGTYQLNWQVLAEADGHVTGGAITFGVKVQPRPVVSAGAVPGTAVAPLKAWTRWADLVLLCAVCGALLIAWLLTRGPDFERPRRRVLGTAAAASAAAVLLGVVLFARELQDLRTSVAPGAPPGDLLTTRWGILWMVREALFGALVALALLLRRRSSTVRFAAGGLLFAGVAVARALEGHAAADPHPLAMVTVAAAHVAAASIWLGGVGAFALALAAEKNDRTRLGRELAGGFAVAAGGALVLLALTGLVAAGAQVASIDALLTTDYGRTLLIKTGLAALAAAFGAVNALLLRRGDGPRAIVAEASTGAAILLAAAVLAASVPAKGPEFAAPRPVAAPTLVGQAGDLLVTATVRPNRPGPNVVTVLTASSRRPAPAPVRAVTLKLQPPSGAEAAAVPLSRVGSGHFAAGINLTEQGRWRTTAVVARGDARASVAFGWSVDRPDPARPVVHSARRLAPIVDRIAVGLTFALLVLAAGLGLWRARQRPRTIRVARIPAR
jgi:copper transport protein